MQLEVCPQLLDVAVVPPPAYLDDEVALVGLVVLAMGDVLGQLLHILAEEGTGQPPGQARHGVQDLGFRIVDVMFTTLLGHGPAPRHSLPVATG